MSVFGIEDLKDLPVVLEAKPGVFGAWIKVKAQTVLEIGETQTGSGYEGEVRPMDLVMKKGELWSGLQKAIRAQDYNLAYKVVVSYLLLCESSKAGLTWLFNRLCVIAKEDCATIVSCFSHAYDLYQKYQGGSGVHVKEILRVVLFLCSHGTSRLPSHMRALHGTRSVPKPAAAVVLELNKFKGQVEKEREITALVGSFTNQDVKEFYLLLESYASAQLESKRGIMVIKLLRFCKSKYGSSLFVKGKVKAGGARMERCGDLDMLLRECIRFCYDQGIDFVVAEQEGLLDNLPEVKIDWAEPLPEHIFDQHVDHSLRCAEGYRYFGTVSSATKNTVLSQDPEYDILAMRAYLEKKGVKEGDIEQMVVFVKGEGRAPQMIHPKGTTVCSPSTLSLKRSREAFCRSDACPSGPQQQALHPGSLQVEEPCSSSSASVDHVQVDYKDETKENKRDHAVTLGSHSLQPYMWKGKEVRYSHSSFKGTKAPTLRTSEGLFLKLFKNASDALYACWAYEVLRELNLPAPQICRVEFLPIKEDLLESVGDGSDQQLAVWKAAYVGKQVPTLVCSTIGIEAADFRKLEDKDMRSESLMIELVKVLLVRRVVLQSSDLCTNNLRVFEDRVYSIDHNQKPNGQIEFIASRFSKVMQLAIKTEVAKNRLIYEEFLQHLKATYAEKADQKFCLL